jgi:hypothetical protein
MGLPKRAKRFSTAKGNSQLSDLAIKVVCHDAFAKQIEAAHLGYFFYVSGNFPTLPILFISVGAARRPQDLVVYFNTKPI